MEKYTSINELAEKVGIHPTNVRRFTKKYLKMGDDYIRIGINYVISEKKFMKKWKEIKK